MVFICQRICSASAKVLNTNLCFGIEGRCTIGSRAVSGAQEGGQACGEAESTRKRGEQMIVTDGFSI